jgi:hypothetical protein
VGCGSAEGMFLDLRVLYFSRYLSSGGGGDGDGSLSSSTGFGHQSLSNRVKKLKIRRLKLLNIAITIVQLGGISISIGDD